MYFVPLMAGDGVEAAVVLVAVVIAPKVVDAVPGARVAAPGTHCPMSSQQ
jgi:hypothetical protein